MEKILSVKIRSFKGSPPCFKTKVPIKDFKQLAILLSDIESNGGNMQKAISEFKKNNLYSG